MSMIYKAKHNDLQEILQLQYLYYRCKGYGTRLLAEIEHYFPQKRYELFTSTRSKDNICLYQNMGYKIFDSKAVNNELQFVYMEKL